MFYKWIVRETRVEGTYNAGSTESRGHSELGQRRVRIHGRAGTTHDRTGAFRATKPRRTCKDQSQSRVRPGPGSGQGLFPVVACGSPLRIGTGLGPPSFVGEASRDPDPRFEHANNVVNEWRPSTAQPAGPGTEGDGQRRSGTRLSAWSAIAMGGPPVRCDVRPVRAR